MAGCEVKDKRNKYKEKDKTGGAENKKREAKDK